MHTDTFEDAYNRLNNAQKEAVDTIEGPVMVIAGPGTGKTQILTLRIANILRATDTQPENILSLTFTESGVTAMRERLAGYIGAPAYRVAIHTFHEFAGKLIREYPDAYSRAVGGRPITDLEKITLIESIIQTPTIKHIRPSGNPQFYIKPIMGAISHMKREYITPDHFAKVIEEQESALAGIQKVHEKGAHKGKVRREYLDKEKKIKKNHELLFVYRAYESALAQERHFDFDDMIFETVEALQSNEDMLRSVQEQYQYMLADEHQDVNGSQNKILELLASYHERPNLFVVGDEKQSIYRFQGASLENFLYFEEKFPHTKTIALTSNYRSAQQILDVAHELITKEESPAQALRVPLQAFHTHDALIQRRNLSHEAVEHAYLADTISALIENGVSPEEIAVIVRTNQEVESLATHFRKQDIDVRASADSDILAHPLTQTIRTLIRVLTNPSDERALFEVLQSAYVGVSVSDIVRIARLRSFVMPLHAVMSDAVLLEKHGVSDVLKIQNLVTCLTSARERVHIDPPHRLLEYIVRESGLLQHTLTTDAIEGSRIIRRLYDEVEEMVRYEKNVTLAHIESMFSTRMSYGLELNAPYIHTGKNAVHVMTAHKSKGLEFECVFIPHLTDNRWGGKRRASQFDIPLTSHLTQEMFDEHEDERKLFYVALTRAKKSLYLSVADTNTEGRAFMPSRLLEDIDASHIELVDTKDVEDAFNPNDVLAELKPSTPLDVTFMQTVLEERGLSVTALNNYLNDPWDYFYRNVLRIPEVQAENALFGTVLHNALQNVFIYRREHDNTLPNTQILKTFIERELNTLPINNDEYTRFHERALVALAQYLEHVANALPPQTKEEYSVHTTLATGIPEFPEVVLNGKLDRLDFDDEGRVVRVVDYKSGKPKTRGEIEGTTKNSDGGYKRQLTFYALLLQLHGNENLFTNDGLISFIEADATGKIHEVLCTVTKEEIELLKGDIIRVVGEIIHGAFFDAPCGSDSQYVHLANELRARMR